MLGFIVRLKKEMTEQWEEWMANGGSMTGGVAKTPSQMQVAEWIMDAYNAITEETGRNT